MLPKKELWPTGGQSREAMVGVALGFVKNCHVQIVPSAVPLLTPHLQGKAHSISSSTRRTEGVVDRAFREHERQLSLLALLFLTAEGKPCYHHRCLMALFAYFQVHRCGAVAQLGARVNGIHEVAGSIPASSTKTITQAQQTSTSTPNHRMTIGSSQ